MKTKKGKLPKLNFSQKVALIQELMNQDDDIIYSEFKLFTDESKRILLLRKDNRGKVLKDWRWTESEENNETVNILQDRRDYEKREDDLRFAKELMDSLKRGDIEIVEKNKRFK